MTINKDYAYEHLRQKRIEALSDDEFFKLMAVPRPPPGYTAEELERDNPYNQWMHESGSTADLDDEALKELEEVK